MCNKLCNVFFKKYFWVFVLHSRPLPLIALRTAFFFCLYHQPRFRSISHLFKEPRFLSGSRFIALLCVFVVYHKPRHTAVSFFLKFFFDLRCNNTPLFLLLYPEDPRFFSACLPTFLCFLIVQPYDGAARRCLCPLNIGVIFFYTTSTPCFPGNYKFECKEIF